ncbi:MAG: serine/threonine-protein kinase [Myxococcota bacterium]
MGRDDQSRRASVLRSTGDPRSDPWQAEDLRASHAFEEVELSSVEAVREIPVRERTVSQRSPSAPRARAPDAPGRERSPSTARGRPSDAPPARSANGPDPRIGSTLVGRYRLEKLIGRGGMGRVYRAVQLPLNRHVAVKVLSPDFQQKDPQFVRRFFLEAASAARLSHPNTITVFDYGESENGELFIAMEYLPGRPLSRVIAAEGRFPAERVLHVAMQICRALREAHAKGIIHRDLKPGNILLMEENEDGDFVKVLDFGLVKLFAPEKLKDLEASSVRDVVLEGDAELTKAGMFLGSPKYMSPEQIQGRPLDPRTDIYALGVLMFHMTTGRPPFTGGSSVDVIVRQVNEAVPTFESLGTEAPELEAIVRRCLAKRADGRYGSMNELLGHLKDLHRLLTGHSYTETGSVPADLSGLDSALASSGTAEAAFDESGLVDPTGALIARDVARMRRGASLGGWLAGGVFVLALGAAAYLIAQPGRPPTPQGRAAPPAPRAGPAQPQVVLDLTSEPAGAEVFLDGVSLGETPTRAELPPDPSEEQVVEFLFRLEGYLDRMIEARPGVTDVPVHALLEPLDNASSAPEASDYKANPY